MSIIEKKIRLEGTLGERKVTALFDSGASVSCIRPDTAKELERPISLRTPLQISTADEKTFVKVNKFVAIVFYIDDYRFWTEFFLVPGLTEEVIIGVSTM